MASKNLWTIVDALRERGEITPSEVCVLLGCDCKKAHHLLGHLVRAGVVTNVGKRYHPSYQLQRGEVNLKPVKPCSPAVVRQACQRASITEQCRQHWQGYQIHKIFGSAGA